MISCRALTLTLEVKIQIEDSEKNPEKNIESERKRILIKKREKKLSTKSNGCEMERKFNVDTNDTNSVACIISQLSVDFCCSIILNGMSIC